MPSQTAHLRILWGTPDRQLSRPPIEYRLLGLGTDSVCSRTPFLVTSYRSTHGHTAHSCRQRYCAGIYSDLNKRTDIYNCHKRALYISRYLHSTDATRIRCEVWYFHNGEDMSCDFSAMTLCNVLVFQRNILLPSSQLKQLLMSIFTFRLRNGTNI
jgi:hypothetical protein